MRILFFTRSLMLEKNGVSSSKKLILVMKKNQQKKTDNQRINIQLIRHLYQSY